MVKGGSASGDGGVIKIPTAYAVRGGVRFPLINVNASMIVDGAPSLNAQPFDGLISLNEVDCEQIRASDQSSWPRSYWSCDSAAPSSNRQDVLIGASLLSPALKSLLAPTLSSDNPKVQIYAMKNATDFYAFQGHELAPGDQTQGVFGTSYAPVRFSAAHMNVTVLIDIPTPDFNQSPKLIQISIIHELAHQLDYIWNLPSAGPAFNTAMEAGYSRLDNLDCDFVFSVSTCLANIDPNTGFPKSNRDILLILDGAMFDKAEAFGRLFAHHYATRLNLGYGISAEVERVYDFFDEANALIDQLITNPPPPTN